MATEPVVGSEGYGRIELYSSAKAAIECLANPAPQLLILDAGLADRNDGWLIAELARETLSPLPRMLFVTGTTDAIPPEIANLGMVFGQTLQ